MAELVRPRWDEYYMNIAWEVATRSNCIKRQVGAILVKEHRIIGSGYNGTPRKIKNCFEGGCRRCNDPNIESGTQLDKCVCSHAEENVIVQCAYHGIATNYATLYTTISPCLWCAKMVINAGIQFVVSLGEYPQDSAHLLKEAGIPMYMRREGTPDSFEYRV